MTATAIRQENDLYRMTKDQFLRVLDSDILDDCEDIEFVEGLLLTNSARTPKHDCTLDILAELFRYLLQEGWRSRTHKTVDLDCGLPEPDISVVFGPFNRYYSHHPSPAEIAFIVEIADTTLTRDRRLKLPGYARNGIAEYWIVNLVDRIVEVYTSPDISLTGEPIYSSRKDYRNGQTIPVFIRGQEIGQIAVDAFLI